MKTETIVENEKTQVHVYCIRKFSQKEYEAILARRKRAAIRKWIIATAHIAKYVIPSAISYLVYQIVESRLLLSRPKYSIGSELIMIGLLWAGLYIFMDWLIGGDEQ